MDLASDVSDDFLSDSRIYLNNASVSLMPLQSIDAMREFLVSYNKLGPDSAGSKQLVLEKLKSARNVISKIINCREEEVILTQSTTDGINFVANGLSFSENSNMIIRGGAHEHHANFYPWMRLQNKIKINSMSIDGNGFFDLDEFGLILDSNTKLVALSHALYNTGAVLPVEQIGKMIGDDACFFVDSAQTVGCVGVDVSKINCDFMSFNGSKWLCGPMGTGLFYCSKKSSSLLEPISIGSESVMAYDESELAFKDIPEKFQTGFRNYVGVVGLESSASYLLRVGLDNISRKIKHLSKMLREELTRISGVTIYGPQDPDRRNSIVAFNIEGFEPETIVGRLEKEGIVLVVREILDKKIVRASPHFFNTESEIIRVIDAIKRL